MLSSWTIPVTERGNLVKDGYHPRDGDQMIEVVSVADVERLLSEVSRDFAGAHVNAGVVVGAVRKRLRNSAASSGRQES